MTTNGLQRSAHAIGLFSGGLDSQLSVCLLRDQGVHVEGVFFDSPFSDPTHARRAAAALGMYLHVVDFTSDIVGIIEKPKHGFGSCLNPCLDCHACMLRRAGELVVDLDYHFIFTGEVLNQRPMSQKRHGLQLVAEESGFADIVLRPLSARLLPKTAPERHGWVDRERLLAIEGRSRQQQIKLAETFGLHDYPTPAGGCRLTEPNFCRRLDDLRKHEGLHGVRALERLRVGRHLRLNQGIKAVVGRNEADNAWLEGNAELYDLILKIEGVPGPTVLLPFTASEQDIETAAAIGVRYSDTQDAEPMWVRVRSPRETRRIQAAPASDTLIQTLMI